MYKIKIKFIIERKSWFYSWDVVVVYRLGRVEFMIFFDY